MVSNDGVDDGVDVVVVLVVEDVATGAAVVDVVVVDAVVVGSGSGVAVMSLMAASFV